MDSNDLFKRLTTNLSFETTPLSLKRKLAHNIDNSDENNNLKKFHRDFNLIKIKNSTENIDQEISGTKKKLTNKKKKKNLNFFKINQEKINHLRNINNINVNGEDIPNPIESLDQLYNEAEFKKMFDDLKEHSKQLIQNFSSYKFDELTPIQMQVIPAMLNNREVMACAPTGSGKTLSFLFPLLCYLTNLKQEEKPGIKALILAPTRELSQQIYLECCRLSNGLNMNPFLISNTNKEIKNNFKSFEKDCTILITTPNRLIFLMSQENFKHSLKTVEWLIVDEADKLFEEGQMGFRDQLGAIYKSCDNPKIKHAFFSATFTNEVEEWCKMNLDNLVQISIGRKNKASYTVQQEICYVGNEEGKLLAVRNLFKEGFEPPILIFVDTKERADYLFKELIYENINVDIISSDRTQQQRDNTMRSFRQGKIWVLICTELLGRGIDFKGVNLVINYDFPQSGISYVHRIGRSGRAGKIGNAITYFTDDDLPYLKKIVNIIREAGCKVPDYMLSLKGAKKKPNKKGLKKNYIKNGKKISFENKKKFKKNSMDKKIKTLKSDKKVDKKLNKKNSFNEAKKEKKTKKNLKK